MTYKKYYTSIPQLVTIHFHMQRFKLIDLMVIEVCFFKKKIKKTNMDKIITSQHNGFCILVIVHRYSP